MQFWQNRDSSDIQHEIWRSVVGYDGLYSVSNYGRVKSFYKKGRILAQSMGNKYLIVTLHKDQVQITKAVHVIVAAAFHKNPRRKKTVNHKDGVKTCNCEWNLEYATSKENINHAHKTGLTVMTGERNVMAKLDSETVLSICNSKETCKSLAKKYKVHVKTVEKIRNGETWSSVTGRQYTRTILDDKIVAKIFKSKLSMAGIAVKYNVGYACVRGIKGGRTYKNVTQNI